MQIYLAVTPQEAPSAAPYSAALACMAYHIGSNSTLIRRNALLQNNGGLLTVSAQAAPLVEDPSALCAAVLRECSRRNYDGVFLNFDSPARHDLLQFAVQLDKTLHKYRKKLYLPKEYIAACPEAFLLVDTALSGGNLAEHLKDVAKTRKNQSILRMERIQMDFSLPARNGTGIPLTTNDFSTLLKEKSPSIYFSPDLCTRYFTYQKGRETHFVLFDDAETLKRKLRLGTECGFSAALFIWSEIRDIADALLK